MASCSKHSNIQCRFFCTTCTVAVCHVCMERGDHVISDHQCIPLSQYFEKKINEVCTILQEAAQRKTECDQIKLKCDNHLEEEFKEIRSKIRLTKLHFIQQVDLIEQSLLKKAEREKARKAKAISSDTNPHQKSFFFTHKQLLEKCQFLLQNLSNQVLDDKHTFQDCHDLLNSLKEHLISFEKEDIIATKCTFVPSSSCSLGKLIVPGDAGYKTGPPSQSTSSEVEKNAEKKRKKTTDRDTKDPQTKKGRKDVSMVNSNGKDLSTKAKSEATSTFGFHVSSQVASQGNASKLVGHRSIPSAKARISTSVSTKSAIGGAPTQSPNAPGPKTPPSAVQKVLHEKNGLVSPAKTGINTQFSVNDIHVKNVHSQCCGIVWADNNLFFEVLTTKNLIYVKRHKISDHGPFQTSMDIKCDQSMDGVKVHVCPKLHPASYSIVLAFNNRVGIIQLKGNLKVTWKIIPNQFTIQAISWREDPLNFVAIVKYLKGGKISVMKPATGSSGKPEFEVRDLPNITSQMTYSFDISCNSEFAICNTLSNSILYFTNISATAPTKEVPGPSNLADAQPVFLLCKDDKKEWIALWIGTSSSNMVLKFSINRYNINFVPLATVIEYKYVNPSEQPKAMSVNRNKVAVLHNNSKVVFHHNLSKMS